MSPYAAGRICPNCRGFIPGNMRFCKPCKTTRDRVRGTSAQRGYGYQWRKIRARVLEQHPICMKCGVEPSDTVDHIITKALGGTDDESNLQALCRRCHSRKTALIDDRWGRR